MHAIPPPSHILSEQTSMTEVGLVSPDQNQENYQLLKDIMAFDLSKLITYVKDRHPEVDVDKAAMQYRYFIYLSVATEKSLPVPNDDVDKVWHAAILHTQDYAVFCQEVAGYFIHHEPGKLTSEQTMKGHEDLTYLSLEHFGKVVFETSKPKSDCKAACIIPKPGDPKLM